jgi:hypothetical protein
MCVGGFFRVAGFGLVNCTASLSRISLIAKTTYRSIAPGPFQHQKTPTEYKNIQKYHCIKGKRAAKIVCGLSSRHNHGWTYKISGAKKIEGGKKLKIDDDDGIRTILAVNNASYIFTHFECLPHALSNQYFVFRV